MTPILLAALFINAVVLAITVVSLLRRHPDLNISHFTDRLDALDRTLAQKFSAATADMASRLEQTKGDLRQQMTDRMAQGFTEIRSSVDHQLASGRNEQAARLAEFGSQMDDRFDALRSGTESRLLGLAESQAESLRLSSATLEQKFEQLSARQSESLGQSRQELANSLAITTTELKREFASLSERTTNTLEIIRTNVDNKLLAISGQVQQKLDENIREGFAHFTKVQDHLKAAEEQLRQVGSLGASINDLNNLLKLPHLRGQFGEASLERLLADFLPSHMYSLQSSPGEGAEHADALIHFPDRTLPIDAKFPREQVLSFFETSDKARLTEARKQLVRVLRTEARRIAQYIQPEHGTMDIALMYLPSETLYFEAVTSAEATEALGKLKVYPVSPNTLLMTLHMVALAYKWYEVAARFEETRKELAKAQTALENFQKKFEEVGRGLDKAQSAYDTAVRHLKHYRSRVKAMSGDETPELEAEQLALAAGEGNGE